MGRQRDRHPEPPAFPIQGLSRPRNILVGRADNLKLPDLKRNDLELSKSATDRLNISKIHQGQIVPIGLVSSDAFVIVEKVAAPIENKPIAIDLDRLCMV